jgi:hypothetical protein
MDGFACFVVVHFSAFSFCFARCFFSPFCQKKKHAHSRKNWPPVQLVMAGPLLILFATILPFARKMYMHSNNLTYAYRRTLLSPYAPIASWADRLEKCVHAKSCYVASLSGRPDRQPCIMSCDKYVVTSNSIRDAHLSHQVFVTQSNGSGPTFDPTASTLGIDRQTLVCCRNMELLRALFPTCSIIRHEGPRILGIAPTSRQISHLARFLSSFRFC